MIRMSAANHNENKEKFLICHSILMVFTVHHIRNEQMQDITIEIENSGVEAIM